MTQPENYISQRGNPFNSKNQGMQNFATETQLDKKVSQLLLNVIPVGESTYVEFQKVDKSGHLFDSIPKTEKPTKLSTKKKKAMY